MANRDHVNMEIAARQLFRRVHACPITAGMDRPAGPPSIMDNQDGSVGVRCAGCDHEWVFTYAQVHEELQGSNGLAPAPERNFENYVMGAYNEVARRVAQQNQWLSEHLVHVPRQNGKTAMAHGVAMHEALGRALKEERVFMGIEYVDTEEAQRATEEIIAELKRDYPGIVSDSQEFHEKLGQRFHARMTALAAELAKSTELLKEAEARIRELTEKCKYLDERLNARVKELEAMDGSQCRTAPVPNSAAGIHALFEPIMHVSNFELSYGDGWGNGADIVVRGRLRRGARLHECSRITQADLDDVNEKLSIALERNDHLHQRIGQLEKTNTAQSVGAMQARNLCEKAERENEVLRRELERLRQYEPADKYTATGEALDRLAVNCFNLHRRPGEGDAELRLRCQAVMKGAPASPPPALENAGTAIAHVPAKVRGPRVFMRGDWLEDWE